MHVLGKRTGMVTSGLVGSGVNGNKSFGLRVSRA